MLNETDNLETTSEVSEVSDPSQPGEVENTETPQLEGELLPEMTEVSETAPTGDLFGFAPQETSDVAPTQTIEIEGRVVPAGDGSNFELRRSALQLRDAMEGHSMMFAETLHSIATQSLYVGWGYPSLDAYIEGELDYGKKHVTNLISIWDYFGRLSSDIQQVIKVIGPTKAGYLVGHLTAENFGEMKPWLMTNPSVASIREWIGKAPKKKAVEESAQKGDAERFSVTVTAEEKELIQKAVDQKRESEGISSPGAAIAAIAGESYLAGEAEPVEQFKALIVRFASLLQGEDGAALLQDALEMINMRVMVLDKNGQLMNDRYLDSEGNPLPA